MRYYLDKFNRPRSFPGGRSVARSSLRPTDVRVVSPADAAKGHGIAGEPVGSPGDVPRAPSTSHATSHATSTTPARSPAVEVDMRGTLDVADDLPTYHAPGPSPSPASEPSPSVAHSSTGAEPSPVSDRADVYPDVESTPSTAAGPELDGGIDAFDVDVPMPSTSSKRVVGDDELALVTAFGEPLAVRLCSPSGSLIPFTPSESERFREAVRKVLEKRTPAWLDEYGDLAMLGLCLYGAAAVRGRAPAPPAMVEALGGRLVVVDLDGERVAMTLDEAKRRGLYQPTTSAPVVERRDVEQTSAGDVVEREAAAST